MALHTHLLIVGAGPFGLAVASYARHLGLDFQVVGRPMEFWKEHMPEGMYLRSASDWHLDATGAATIEEYLRGQGLTPADVEPLSRAFYLGYVEWFRRQKGIEPISAYVQRLERVDTGNGAAPFIEPRSSEHARHATIDIIPTGQAILGDMLIGRPNRNFDLDEVLAIGQHAVEVHELFQQRR